MAHLSVQGRRVAIVPVFCLCFSLFRFFLRAGGALQQELLKTIFSICAPPANTGASRMCRRAMPICASWGHRVIATEPFVKHFCLLFLLSELPLQQLQPLFLELGCRADSKADDRAARVSKGRVQATLTLVDARVQARTTAV